MVVIELKKKKTDTLQKTHETETNNLEHYQENTLNFNERYRNVNTLFISSPFMLFSPTRKDSIRLLYKKNTTP